MVQRQLLVIHRPNELNMMIDIQEVQGEVVAEVSELISIHGSGDYVGDILCLLQPGLKNLHWGAVSIK